MIRVLHIVHALTRGGGLSNFVMNYYRNIDRDKIQFDFVYFRDASATFDEEIKMLGGRVYKWKEPDVKGKYIRSVEKFFDDHRGEYTAIHCHALFAVAAYSGIAKKHGVKNIIAHSHNVGYGKNGVVRKLRNCAFVLACRYYSTHKLACSENAAIFMFGNKAYINNKIVIIPNAVNCQQFFFDLSVRNKTREELGIGDEFIVGHVGGFAKQKNHRFLIELFKKYLSINPNAKLLLVGGDGIASGSTLPEIKDYVSKIGISDRVIFTGIRSDVNSLMMAMDIFVFPSTFEGFGLVLVEAQSSGLFCLASDNIPKDAKCTENVTFLSLNDMDLWVESITNHSTYERMVQPEWFDKYNIVKNAKILESFYLNLEK